MLTALLWAIGLLLLFTAFLYLSQRQLIFPAPPGATPEYPGDGIEHVHLDTGHALLALPTTGASPAPLIAFTHGNAELAYWSLDEFRYFRDRGFAVLLLEYPGYGGAPGSPTAASIRQSALQAFDRVTARADIDAHKVIAYGRSIGSGAACMIAGERRNDSANIRVSS